LLPISEEEANKIKAEAEKLVETFKKDRIKSANEIEVNAEKASASLVTLPGIPVIFTPKEGKKY